MQNDQKSKSRHHFKNVAKNWVNDHEGRLSDLRAAVREGRQGDFEVLAEQVFQSIGELRTELNAPTPASSLQAGGSVGSVSDQLNRLLQRWDVEDDATSAPAQFPVMEPQHGTEQINDSLPLGDFTAYHDGFLGSADTQNRDFHGLDQTRGFPDLFDNIETISSDLIEFFDSDQFILDEGIDYGLPVDINANEGHIKDTESSKPSYVSPPPAAFMGPKCALWDCTRPAQGSESSSMDYCCSLHREAAVSDGGPGRPPTVRPKGIGMKDNFLFDALTARIQGKEVGIPQCVGAASTRSPWNAPDLFDISLFEEETLREWVFFDEPRRAYDSGSRKQRSLPDYKGRGWHESRKQVILPGCQKRSYYMDPQPSSSHEWHLYEYQVLNSDAGCALYKLEYKIAEGKKTPRGKVSKASLADLQMKMNRLNADGTPDNSPGNVKAESAASGAVP
ncbi:Transcription factor VOZ1 [Linum grandiflorum]